MNYMFHFKQFSVADEKCGMKVGTDGTIHGAWAPVPEGKARILDIGTGSGLMALIFAQRCPEAEITGVDIDAGAAEQAAENFASSPWADRLHVLHKPVQQLEEGEDDLVASNPPYFVDSLKNPDADRLKARHTDTLSFSALVNHSARLAKVGGIVSYVLPIEAEQPVLHLAADCGLTPIHITRVHTRNTKPAKRVMIAFRKAPTTEPCLIDTLCLMDQNGEPRSEQYKALCRDFYL